MTEEDLGLQYWGLHQDLPALDDLISRHKDFMSSHDLATAGKHAEKAVANFLLKVVSSPRSSSLKRHTQYLRGIF